MPRETAQETVPQLFFIFPRSALALTAQICLLVQPLSLVKMFCFQKSLGPGLCAERKTRKFTDKCKNQKENLDSEKNRHLSDPLNENNQVKAVQSAVSVSFFKTSLRTMILLLLMFCDLLGEAQILLFETIEHYSSAP